MAANGGFARTLVCTGLAMLAFAGNSIISRLALRGEAIDPASFTSIRLLSGAAALLIIAAFSRRGIALRGHGSWPSAGLLFLYAASFSFAYVSLEAGIGALILFAFVQGTMIAVGLWSGDRPALAEWLGWGIAGAGLAWLLSPGLAAPSPGGAALMAMAGISWGLYSLRGRDESRPLDATASNFVMALAPVALLTILTFDHARLDAGGVRLAILSGALTSGVGYVIWYAALESLTAMRAALVQLTVPAIAAAGGVLLLGEAPTVRLLLASGLVLGGICVAVLGRTKSAGNS